MTYDGDVKLYPSADGGDIAFEAGQPYMDAGLETAAYISLFTAVYWGNAIAAESEKTSSQIETLFRRVLDNRARLDAYECGIQPTPQPMGGGKFPVKYYLTAMLFIVFDIEIVFLYPWAVSFDALGIFGLVEMLLFIATLLAAYIYVWRRGGLEWD